jgi:hypothetical protein
VIRALALVTFVLCLALAGCGGDDSSETTSVPSVSIPAITSPIPTTPTATAPATTTTTPTGSTTTTGRGNGGVNPSQPDSETNDVPPPPGSPQEKFEKQCQQNPAACG